MNKKLVRKLKRALITQVAPKSLSHSLIRKSIKIPSLNDSGLTFKIAQTPDEQNQALALLYKAYRENNLMQEHPSGMRITPYHMLPTTITPIVKKDDKVIATMSVFLGTPFGLPIEAICGLENLFEVNDRVVEVSSLAVDQNYSGHRGEVLFPMMKFMYHCNIDLMHADYELIVVNPNMASLYEALLLFKPLPKKSNETYNFVNGAPAIPLLYNLKKRYESYGKYYGKAKPHQNLMHFFELDLPENFHLPKSLNELDLPQQHLQQFKYLFCEQSDILKSISPQQKKVLLQAYQNNKEIYDFIQSSFSGQM